MAMRLFENDAQLAKALRVLSEAGLIDIVAGDDGKPRFQLSAASQGRRETPCTPSGRIEAVADRATVWSIAAFSPSCRRRRRTCTSTVRSDSMFSSVA